MKRFILGITILLSTGFVLATEEPKYTLIEQSAEFELRAYSPKIVAETWVSGDLDDASNAGFKLIADYIFGNNTASTNGSGKISMTSPVTMEEANGKWRMHFVMPSEYTMETLPKPNNPAVTIREVPSEKYAVILFSWFAGEEKVANKTTELMTWLASKNITPTGKPELARYNPPWTPPFLRRNEVMVSY